MSKNIDKEKAIANLRPEAQNRLIKNEIMRFRLESETFERLLKYARKINKPVGTLVREWVVEKLNQLESKPKQSPQIKAINIITTSLAEQGLLETKEVGRINKLLAEQTEQLPY